MFAMKYDAKYDEVRSCSFSVERIPGLFAVHVCTHSAWLGGHSW